METLRMDYRFTALLIVMMTMLALFGGPANSKNEYLNTYTNECREGEIDLAITKREDQQDYRTYDTSDYDNDSHELRLSFRKNLGLSKKNLYTK